MNCELEGRTALVTGASKGMGRAVAHGLAKEGVSVCLSARNEEALALAAEEIENDTGTKTYWKTSDVSNLSDITNLVEYTEKKLGKIDILISNAGGPKPGGILSLSEQDWADAIDLTLLSTVRLSSLVVPKMIERKWGRIITITSTVAKEPAATMILSATARAGVTAFSKSLSLDVAPLGVTVNTVCPGGVYTDRLRNLLEMQSEKQNIPFNELLDSNKKIIPIGRYADPEEIADYIVFLCSERGRYITGTSLSVDGGLTKGLI